MTKRDTSPPREGRIILSGSKKPPVIGSRVIGRVDPIEQVQITVIVRRHKEIPSDLLNQTTFAARKYLKPEELEKIYGASEEDLEKIESFAHEHGLSVVEINSAGRTVILRGNAREMSTAFGVELHRYEHNGKTFRGRQGVLTIPNELEGIIESVHGLDNREQARAHFRVLKSEDFSPHMLRSHDNAALEEKPFFPNELARIYNFPTDLDGTGQCIAIVELGGGHIRSDLKAYFSSVGLTIPNVKSVSVSGGHNNPTGDPRSADSEVMLDIEVAGVIAPKSKIVVYYAPNTDDGFLNAIIHAVHDSHNAPSVISISWGGPEKDWTEQSLNAFNEAFKDAAALGITVCCAAGDDGSSDERPPPPPHLPVIEDSLAHVDFPASSPFVLACGGTKLIKPNGSVKETVWNETASREGATGGGISDVFEMPDYQNGANISKSVNGGDFKGRGLPDVCGNADPVTGYNIRVDGNDTVIGGTSASAPLWAGLIAIMNQGIGSRVGLLNPILYKKLGPNIVLRDISKGENSVINVIVNGVQTKVKGYEATSGWDACTGWGSPDGIKLLASLKTA